jgi:hypothetical protein
MLFRMLDYVVSRYTFCDDVATGALIKALTPETSPFNIPCNLGSIFSHGCSLIRQS